MGASIRNVTAFLFCCSEVIDSVTVLGFEGSGYIVQKFQ